MRLTSLRAAATALALALAAPSAPAAEQAELQPAAKRVVDPCNFFRQRARGHGVDHWSREVVWACEAVAQRRDAGMALTDRMLAVEFALVQFRAAVTHDRRERVARPGPRGEAFRVAQEAAIERLAEESGMLAALEGVRQGF